MLAVTGLEKYKAALVHITQLSGITETRMIQVKVVDNAVFTWRDWYIAVDKIPISIYMRKEGPEVDISFPSENPSNISIWKFGQLPSPVNYHRDSIINLTNPIYKEYLQLYRSITEEPRETSVLPSLMIGRILGHVWSTLNRLQDYHGVSYETGEERLSSLLERIRSTSTHSEKRWVIEHHPQSNKALIVQASTPSQAYAQALLENLLPAQEENFFSWLSQTTGKKPTEMNYTTLEFYFLVFMSQAYPIHSI